jgi:hypothetical protein
MDLMIGIENGRLKGVRRRLIESFAINERNGIRGHFAGQFACGMSAHAIGHHEKMAALLKISLISSKDYGLGILIIGPTKAHIADSGVF